MLVEIPDHYLPTLGQSMVEYAVDVINRADIVPGFLHQLASLWDKGIHYPADDRNFWVACYDAGARATTLKRAGLL